MKKMKKWELLKKAYDTYPAGTKLTWDTEVIVSTGIFEFGADDVRKGWLLDSKGMAVYDGHGWAEIIKQDESKPKSILSGKCAIQVNNGREFELLMQHMHSKGWKWNGGDKITSGYTPCSDFPFSVWYEDECAWDNVEVGEDRTLIQFADFAKEVGIEVPIFVMMSEDGVSLFEGDDYHRVQFGNKWYYAHKADALNLTDCVMITPESNKAFSTKEAAEKWIKEQNKPKEIIVAKNSPYPISITKNGATINCIGDVHQDNIILRPGEINEMSDALEQLNAQS